MLQAAAMAAPEGFTDADLEKIAKFKAFEKVQHVTDERKKAQLTTARSLRRNETGAPFNVAAACTARSESLPKDIVCAATDPACPKNYNRGLGVPVVLAAPGELFWFAVAHRKGALNAATPEVDPAAVIDEVTLQDRLLRDEFRSVEQRAEAPAVQAAKILADLEAQRRILEERIVQQCEELARRQAHVDAAKAKTEEFLASRSEAWREALLAGTPEASLAAAARAAAEAETRRPEIHTNEDIRRAAASDVGPGCFTIGPGGQPVRLKERRS
jgi:hypothetical protein